jgi:hypothetical protein
MTTPSNSYKFRLLKILALVLGSGLFIPVSCTSIEVALLMISSKTPFENIEPSSRYYPLFFRVAMQSEGEINYSMLADIAKLKTDNPNFSFLLPKAPDQCESFVCYQVLSDNGTEQLIEVTESPDSLFAFKVWSRYRATHSDFTPISLKKSSMNIIFYAFAGSLVLYVIGKMLRKKRDKMS